mgnify:CR=1 FL=1
MSLNTFKPQNQQQKNKQKRKSWFEQQKQQFGDSFLESISGMTFRNGCRMITEDMFYGRLDLNKEYIYFYNINLLSHLIDFTARKYNYYNIMNEMANMHLEIKTNLMMQSYTQEQLQQMPVITYPGREYALRIKDDSHYRAQAYYAINQTMGQILVQLQQNYQVDVKAMLIILCAQVAQLAQKFDRD